MYLSIALLIKYVPKTFNEIIHIFKNKIKFWLVDFITNGNIIGNAIIFVCDIFRQINYNLKTNPAITTVLHFSA